VSPANKSAGTPRSPEFFGGAITPARNSATPAPNGMDAGNTAWHAALLAGALFAIDPIGLGGIRVRAHAGPVRDRWQQYLDSLLPEGTSKRRIIPNVADDRLIGGLDITATLRAGRPVAERGLLAEADGGTLVLAMAERLPAKTAARIAAAMDRGAFVMARDGLATEMPSRFGLVVLDEGIGEDEMPPGALLERLALHADLRDVPWGEASGRTANLSADDVAHARDFLARVTIGDELVKRLCQVSLDLGIASTRAPYLALRAARAAAALDQRTEVKEADAILAVKLVLAHRAQSLPAPPESDEEAEPPEPPDDPEEPGEQQTSEQIPEEILLAAAKAALPHGLLDQLRSPAAQRGAQATAGHAGALANSAKRGRPIGVRARPPRDGARLNVIETLRAAAPWQRLRRNSTNMAGTENGRVIIRPEDFRVTRFKQRSETMTIFVVDASGSTALTRLAEAKGAVELLLADCYIRRDQVALIGFRGGGAEVLLPPTRSLTRAKRSLAGLPGGGGTPLASGLSEGLDMARSAVRRGQTPLLVVLTDGRANVGLDGKGGRQRAETDALSIARAVDREGFNGLVVDTAPRPQKPAQRLATALGVRYMPLPLANASSLSQAVRAVST